MITPLLKKIFGSKNERELRRLQKIVQQINALEPQMEGLQEADFKDRTAALKARAAQGENLDKLLPESFALVREASRRALGLRHFDVQLIGGMVLHEGRIAEMRTGEGKTLMSTLAVYLNALTGQGVHLVTVNDYLARRDADWMGKLYDYLGLSVGVIYSGQSQDDKRLAYQADITYGTNNEFGFDYLRDNMAFSLQDRVQRDLCYAVVDEVDSILIDEARTPLIISGAAEDHAELYHAINRLIPGLKPWDEAAETGDFIIDEKQRTIELTEQGHQLVEELLSKEGLLRESDSLYAAANLNLLHHVHSALRAHHMFHRDVDYIVTGGQVIIVDEHTGRTMPGRRWGEGLHQAVEAKEGVRIQAESQTLASTTFQNYFRLYDKLAGMTGTADTEAYELNQIYGLDVVVIPPNRPVLRKDLDDLVYMSSEEKYQAIIENIRHCVSVGRPVLVGTASIETSEYVSGLLNKTGIPHKVLNAKQHESEAEIIAQAGRPGAVTLATNMAGRGTDILLGGNWEAEADKLKEPTDEQVRALQAEWQVRHDQVVAAGGLHVIGTERHESRRIDNQLRGRAGRQGDPGSTRFFLSMEDNLMRIFASDRVKNMMTLFGMKPGEAIEHKMVTNAVEKAQRKVESRNFDIRKQLLEYDNVNNDQRRVIYTQRLEILKAEDIAEEIAAIRQDVLNEAISQFIPPQSMPEQWRIAELEKHLELEFNLPVPIQQWLDEDKSLHEESLRDKLQEALQQVYDEKATQAGPELLRKFEHQVMLQVLDSRWKEHLQNMDQLRQGIHLRGYAQKNPKQEYKREAYQLFGQFLAIVHRDVTRILSHMRIRIEEEVDALERQRREEAEQLLQRQKAHHGSPPESVTGGGGIPDASAQPFKRDLPKVGRNDPCPCGSGKKFKQCHGKLN